MARARASKVGSQRIAPGVPTSLAHKISSRVRNARPLIAMDELEHS